MAAVLVQGLKRPGLPALRGHPVGQAVAPYSGSWVQSPGQAG